MSVGAGDVYDDYGCEQGEGEENGLYCDQYDIRLVLAKIILAQDVAQQAGGSA